MAGALLIVLLLAIAPSARANLVQDGDFSQVTYSGSMAGITTLFGQFGTGYLTVADWTTTGYNFVFAPNTADEGTSGSGAYIGQPNEVPGQYNTGAGYGKLYIWGSNNGGTVTLPATDPVGGNFIAGDGAFEVGAISQSISGLTAGQTYVLKFYWAAAQQQGYTTAVTDSWTVSLGGESFSTGTYSLVSGSFSGWMPDTMYFTATNATETLSFLSVGAPTGQPPFSLLGGVDLEVVPDFSNWMVFGGFGLGCIVFESARRKRRRSRPAAE